MPRVISYTRFSSSKQAKGDSYRRQTEMALKWCLKHGLDLDTSFVLEDLGVSGYSGANAKRGALGVLQKLCLDGKLEPGTVLLIEALDRLTRLPLPDAYELLLSLINNGLTIVTLTDDKVWTKDKLKNLEDFMMSLVTLYRGYQESSYKSGRLRSTFQEHRERASNQAFGSAPGWLYRDSKTEPWKVDDAKATAVREVFELSAAGLGSKAIAEIANAENWPVPMRLNKTEGRWHAQMPGRILRSRTVLGEHEYRIRTHEANDKHWEGAGTGILVADFYPRIVPDDLWHRSRASIGTRSVAKRRDSHAYNIWSGLLYCGFCGAPLQRKQEKKGNSRAQISCADKLAGITKCPTFSASYTDATLLKQIYEFAPDSLGTEGGEDGLQKMAALEAQLNDKTLESRRIADAIARTDGKVDSLVHKAISINDELQVIRIALDEERQVNALSDDDITFDPTFVNHAMNHLYATDDESRVIRAGIHLKMARLVETIWIWAYDLAIVQFKDGTRLTVGLHAKTLPSRAKPASKHHKPPKPKLTEQPYLEQAFAGTLVVPTAQRRNVQKKNKSKPYYLVENRDDVTESLPWIDA